MPSPQRIAFSIITPNLNGGRYLERTICSVLDQGRADVEYFVADGGSTDDSVELIQTYENELAGWRSGPDGGAGAAVNWALQRAAGVWVVLLPSGDVLMPGALDALAKAIERQPRADWFHGHAHRLDEEDQSIGLLTAPGQLSLVRWLLHDTDSSAVAANACRRTLFDTLGPMSTTLGQAWHYEWVARLLAAGHTPTLVAAELAGQRCHTYRLPAPQTTLQVSHQIILAAERFIDRLSHEQRPVLWRNLDERRQILAIAEAEAAGVEGQKLLWRRLMDRPWWINSDRYRRAIVRTASSQLQAQDQANQPQRKAA